jgi:hypothetical protein
MTVVKSIVIQIKGQSKDLSNLYRIVTTICKAVFVLSLCFYMKHCKTENKTVS